MNKKRLLLACTLSLVVVFFPFPSADVHLKIYFDEIKGSQCALYYETKDAPGFSQDRCIKADLSESAYVDFRLEASLAEQITGLRIDMPEVQQEQVLCIKNVTVCSAGVIQKSFNPCYFMDSVNIADENEMHEISLVKIRNRAYIKCGANDPYWILSSDLVQKILAGQSNYKGTRFGILIFLCGCYFFGKMSPFPERTLECEEWGENHEQ